MLVEPASQLAPPVVAVMVVHEPGEWFDEVLVALAEQDYTNLKVLVLVVGEPGDVPERVGRLVPRSFVRVVADSGDVGFGPAANEVLRLVEGENGFFCFLHDDVALDPDAVRLLVEELYRSNAGIVGPKLVTWDDPSVLQHVCYGVDRFADVDPIVEPGETDQEQHDAVRDVFALPSACLLVRADLFHSLGGFDRTLAFHGEDVDLCWRAHLQGARVVVVPSARARHLEALPARRPDLPHVTLRERHRLRTAATLTGGRRLPALLAELVVVTLAQFVVAVVSGHAARGWAGVRGLVALVPAVPRVVARRRVLAPSRSVPDREVVGMQIRGSARVAAWLRSRDARPDPLHQSRAWRERSGGAAAVGLVLLLVGVVVGSRHLVTGGVPRFGQFMPFPGGPRDLLSTYASGWNARGLGATGPAPTGIAAVGIAGAVALGRMGLLHTASVVGLVAVGAIGAWRLTGAFSLTRSRLVTSAVYALVPLPAALLSMGRWSALLVYAGLPWSVDAMRRSAGLLPGPSGEAGERSAPVGVRHQVRLVAGGALAAGVVVAFVPAHLPVLLVVAGVLAVATLITGAPPSAAARLAVAGGAAVAGAALLGLPWLAAVVGDHGWRGLVGPGAGGRPVTAGDLLVFDVGRSPLPVLSIALYLPVLGAVLLGRGWRFGWAVRGAALVVVFGWLAVLAERDSLPVAAPEAGILLVPVALGVALCAGCVVASFELEVRGGSFGWRQPVAVLCMLAVAVGAIPGVLALGGGRWSMPQTTLVDLRGWFPDDPREGEYRVLWVGDLDVVPVVPTEYRPGVGYAISEGGRFDITQQWAPPTTAADAEIEQALDAIAQGTTTRAGRLLAPYAIRYVVVPVVDGAVSTARRPVAPPEGLLDALADQLDLGSLYSPVNFTVYENEAWVPVRGVLSEGAAAASRVAGPTALAQAELAATPALGADPSRPGAPVAGDVPAGTFHLAVPFGRRWQLDVGGSAVPARPAFGSTTAFDVAAGGRAELSYDTSGAHRVAVAVQAALWLAALVAAAGVGMTRYRRVSRRIDEADEPLITFDPLVTPPDPAQRMPGPDDVVAAAGEREP